MVLELARREVGGDTVALDPGGFWSDRELKVFSPTLRPLRCQHGQRDQSLSVWVRSLARPSCSVIPV